MSWEIFRWAILIPAALALAFLFLAGMVWWTKIEARIEAGTASWWERSLSKMFVVLFFAGLIIAGTV